MASISRLHRLTLGKIHGKKVVLAIYLKPPSFKDSKNLGRFEDFLESTDYVFG
jgi:hypothetical protein